MKRRLNTLMGVGVAMLIAVPAISYAGASHIFYQQKKSDSEVSARADQAAPQEKVVKSADSPHS